MVLESMREINKLDVLLGERTVGTLASTVDGLAAFQYSPEWLNSGFAISPFSLPLESRVFVAKPHPLDGVFGIFSDSLPDEWGRLLVDRVLKSRGVDPREVGFLPRLAMVGSSGSGALEYRPALEIASALIIEDLDKVANECAEVLAARDAQDLDALFAMGGSSGGTRPKVFYTIDGEEWIVKFPSSADPASIGEDEYHLALAAKRCGIEMPEVRLLPSRRCGGYFATKRFDRKTMRDGSVARVHMASVSALLETSHRIPNLDYKLLMRLTLKLTGSMEQVERMFRLMAFNVLCGNRDDHSKNFSFLHDEGRGWRLSPAYDLTSNPGFNGQHATTVNGKGRDIVEADMLSVAQDAGISPSHAKGIIECVREALLHEAV